MVVGWDEIAYVFHDLRGVLFVIILRPNKQGEMGSPVTTSESCLKVKSVSLEGGPLGGTATSINSRGRLGLSRPMQDNFGALHYIAQTAHHQLDDSPSWPANQLLSNSQAICPKSIDYQANVQSPFLLSKNKSSGTSDEDESSWKQATEERQSEKGKQMSPWQRIKWTNDMIKFLIDIVHYVGEDGICDNLDINKRSILQKKGKWRSVSSAMNEKGWYVSPQQCEDKFNDLNKRYKRLSDILGRETALQVVDNVHLLDNMNNLSAKRKEDVKKILSSRHSFYKEMHFYHSGTKSPMACDRQTCSGRSSGEIGTGSARSMLMQNMGVSCIDIRADMESSFAVNLLADNAMVGVVVEREPLFPENSSKRPHAEHGTHCCSGEEASLDLEATRTGQDEGYSEQDLVAWRRRQIYLEGLKVGLQAQTLELATQRHRWHQLKSKKNDELEKLRIENKRMKLENDHLSHQLKQKELEVECKRSVTSMALFDLVLDKLRAKEQRRSVQEH